MGKVNFDINKKITFFYFLVKLFYENNDDNWIIKTLKQDQLFGFESFFSGFGSNIHY